MNFVLKVSETVLKCTECMEFDHKHLLSVKICFKQNSAKRQNIYPIK